MSERKSVRVGRRRRDAYLPAVILLITLVAGCAWNVRLVGEYDEITDQGVTALYQKTTSFFAKMKTVSGSEASYEANREFYEKARGDVALLMMRAKISEEGLRKNPLTRNFEDLQAQYQDLAELHRMTLNSNTLKSAEDAFEQSFRAIFESLLYLKWNKEPPEPGE